MKHSRTALCVLSVAIACCSVTECARAAAEPFDPTKQITRGFPGTVELKDNGRLLEFCPDGTCDAFAASGPVSVATLKDFAYLYVYFFSDYTFLDDWRGKAASKSTAERVLSKPAYQKCERDDSREAARCVLLDLSREGRIKLLFIRYDEGQRNVVHEDITKELSQKARDGTQ